MASRRRVKKILDRYFDIVGEPQLKDIKIYSNKEHFPYYRQKTKLLQLISKQESIPLNRLYFIDDNKGYCTSALKIGVKAFYIATGTFCEVYTFFKSTMLGVDNSEFS